MSELTYIAISFIVPIEYLSLQMTIPIFENLIRLYTDSHFRYNGNRSGKFRIWEGGEKVSDHMIEKEINCMLIDQLAMLDRIEQQA